MSSPDGGHRVKERLQAYLASPTQVYYALHIAGNWFAPATGPQTK
jgi:hypothetical protein